MEFDLLTTAQIIVIIALFLAIVLKVDVDNRLGFDCEADLGAVAAGMADCAGLNHDRLPLFGG